MNRQDKQKSTPSKEQIVEEMLGPLLDWAIEEKVDELEVKGGLLMPKEAYIKQQRAQMLESFYDEMHLMNKSMEEAGNLLYKSVKLLPQQEKEKISEELKKAFSLISSLTKDFSVKTKEGQTLQEILNLSNKTLLWVYEIAYDFFIKNAFEESTALFQFLVILNNLVTDYWIALGLSQRRLGWEDKALGSFLIASNLDPSHPTPKYNIAEIYCNMGHLDQAQVEIDNLLDMTKEPKNADLRSSVQVLQDKIRMSKKAS